MATSTQAIEVETKFAIPAGLEEKLEQHRGTLLHHKSFRDVYYDTHCSHLYLSDFWLRRRDQVWELKCPPRGLQQLVKGSTQYEEFDVEAEILRELQRVLPRDLDVIHAMNDLDLFKDDNGSAKIAQNCAATVTEGDLADSPWKTLSLTNLTEKYLEQIATFVTDRKTYRVQDYLVVLDRADFGYTLGEIEKVVHSQDDVAEARRGIDQLAEKLGIEVGGPRIPGKINVYLRQENPKLFSRLASKLVKDGKMDA